ncbi:MAG: hypothetical protein ACM3QV_00350 [Caulobacteraceae bacterium]
MVMRNNTLTAFMILGAMPSASSSETVPVNVSVLEYGPKEDIFHVGDRVDLFIKLKNTGKVALSYINMKVELKKEMPIEGFVTVMKDDLRVSMNLKPGETKTISRAGTLPDQYVGLAMPGNYIVTLSVLIDDFEIFRETKNIKVLAK